VRQATSDATGFRGSFTSVDRPRLGDPTSYRITKLAPGARYRVSVTGTEPVEVNASATGEVSVSARFGTHVTTVLRAG
jgi:hypothetical protein